MGFKRFVFVSMLFHSMERQQQNVHNLQTADCRKHGVDIPDPAARGQNQHLRVVTRAKTNVCLWRRGERTNKCLATGAGSNKGKQARVRQDGRKETLGFTSTDTIKGRGSRGVRSFISNTYSLHCHHQNDSALRWAVV